MKYLANIYGMGMIATAIILQPETRPAPNKIVVCAFWPVFVPIALSKMPED